MTGTQNIIKNIFLLSVVFICSLLPSSARSESDFFVRIYPDKETVYEGDSLLVSVVLHASFPIHHLEEIHPFKHKGKCQVRPLGIRKDPTNGQTRIGNQIYYTLVWEQYVITPQGTGRYEFISPQFKGILHEVTRMPDWIDQMMGARPEYKEHKVKAPEASFSFQIKEKPLRTTEEMMRDRIVF